MKKVQMANRFKGHVARWAVVLLMSVLNTISVDADVVVGPYLQGVMPHGAVLMWEETTGEMFRVQYRQGSEPWKEKESRPRRTKEATYIHQVKLEGLWPGTVYQYRLAKLDWHGEAATFQTAPETAEPFRFVVWGDNQDGEAIFKQVIERMVASDPDLLMSVGDIVHKGTDYPSWRQEYFGPIKTISQHLPTYVAVGNHEYLDRDAYWYDQYFGNLGHGRYYSFNYSNCHFIVLDNAEGHTRYGFTPYTRGSEQYQWLVRDLQSPAAIEADFRLVFMHVPPYSRATWGGEEDSRRDLVPLFEAHGVDAVFSGHHHLYEQGRWPRAGFPAIRYVVTGGGGGGLREPSDNSLAENPWPQVTANVIGKHHFCVIDVDGPKLTCQAVDLNGNVIDRFEIGGTTGVLPPQRIRVSPADRRVTIFWQPNHLSKHQADGGVVIYRGHGIDGPFEPIARLEQGHDVYVDQDVVNDQVYYYRLAALDPQGRAGEPSGCYLAVPRPLADLAQYAFEEEDDLDHFRIVDLSSGPAAPSIWRVQQSRLCQLSVIGEKRDPWAGSLMLLDGVAGGDLVFDVDIENLGEGAAGVVFGYLDSENYYQLQWNQKTRQVLLAKKLTGHWATLDQASIPLAGKVAATGAYHVRVKVVGPQIIATIDGGGVSSGLTLKATSDQPVLGRVGLSCWRSQPVYFDHLSVRSADLPERSALANHDWSWEGSFAQTHDLSPWIMYQAKPNWVASPLGDTPKKDQVLELASTGERQSVMAFDKTSQGRALVQASVYCAIEPMARRADSREPRSRNGSIVINQIHFSPYGFVELYNNSDVEVVLDHWSLQASRHTSKQWRTTQGDVLTLDIVMPPRSYYLLGTEKEYAAQTMVPDKLWIEARNAGYRGSGGAIALVRHAQPIQSANDPGIVDLVGWGPKDKVLYEGSGPLPLLEEGQALLRKPVTVSVGSPAAPLRGTKVQDTNDNAHDFTVIDRPIPRSSERPDDVQGVGVFLWSDGSDRFIDGNCYYLLWDPQQKTFHAGKAVDGKKTSFKQPQMPVFDQPGWHVLRIDARDEVISFWVDGRCVARVIDHEHQTGVSGLAVRQADHPTSKPRSGYFADFKAMGGSVSVN